MLSSSSATLAHAPPPPSSVLMDSTQGLKHYLLVQMSRQGYVSRVLRKYIQPSQGGATTSTGQKITPKKRLPPVLQLVTGFQYVNGPAPPPKLSIRVSTSALSGQPSSSVPSAVKELDQLTTDSVVPSPSLTNATPIDTSGFVSGTAVATPSASVESCDTSLGGSFPPHTDLPANLDSHPPTTVNPAMLSNPSLHPLVPNNPTLHPANTINPSIITYIPHSASNPAAVNIPVTPSPTLIHNMDAILLNDLFPSLPSTNTITTGLESSLILSLGVCDMRLGPFYFPETKLFRAIFKPQQNQPLKHTLVLEFKENHRDRWLMPQILSASQQSNSKGYTFKVDLSLSGAITQLTLEGGPLKPQLLEFLDHIVAQVKSAGEDPQTQEKKEDEKGKEFFASDLLEVSALNVVVAHFVCKVLSMTSAERAALPLARSADLIESELRSEKRKQNQERLGKVKMVRWTDREDRHPPAIEPFKPMPAPYKSHTRPSSCFVCQVNCSPEWFTGPSTIHHAPLCVGCARSWSKHRITLAGAKFQPPTFVAPVSASSTNSMGTSRLMGATSGPGLARHAPVFVVQQRMRTIPPAAVPKKIGEVGFPMFIPCQWVTLFPPQRLQVDSEPSGKVPNDPHVRVSKLPEPAAESSSKVSKGAQAPKVQPVQISTSRGRGRGRGRGGRMKAVPTISVPKQEKQATQSQKSPPIPTEPLVLASDLQLNVVNGLVLLEDRLHMKLSKHGFPDAFLIASLKPPPTTSSASMEHVCRLVSAKVREDDRHADMLVLDLQVSSYRPSSQVVVFGWTVVPADMEMVTRIEVRVMASMTPLRVRSELVKVVERLLKNFERKDKDPKNLKDKDPKNLKDKEPKNLKDEEPKKDEAKHLKGKELKKGKAPKKEEEPKDGI